MGFIGIFQKILRKETTGRAQLPGLVRDMRNDAVAYRRQHMHKDAPAVEASMTESSFRKAYRNLQICSVISFSYLVGIIVYNVKTPDMMLFVTSLAMGVIGLIGHFSFVVRAYRAREVASQWSRRGEPMRVTPSEVIDASLSDPLILMPALKALHFPSDKITKK